jgi:DNA-binding transcriptional ArsR family regulator
MDAFEILGDPVRRRVMELLANGEMAAGEVGAIVQTEFGITQPAVSQHLRVLRENGFAEMRPDGTRRIYSARPDALVEVDRWIEPYRRFWNQRLDALATEVARGKRNRRREPSKPSKRKAA